MLQPPAEHGRSLRGLLDVIVQAAENYINAPSGGALAFIPGSGLVSSAAADLIAGVFNRYSALSAVSPAMVALEAEVLQWIAMLMGFPETSGGLLTFGAAGILLQVAAEDLLGLARLVGCGAGRRRGIRGWDRLLQR